MGRIKSVSSPPYYKSWLVCLSMLRLFLFLLFLLPTSGGGGGYGVRGRGGRV